MVLSHMDAPGLHPSPHPCAQLFVLGRDHCTGQPGDGIFVLAMGFGSANGGFGVGLGVPPKSHYLCASAWLGHRPAPGTCRCRGHPPSAAA